MTSNAPKKHSRAALSTCYVCFNIDSFIVFATCYWQTILFCVFFHLHCKYCPRFKEKTKSRPTYMVDLWRCFAVADILADDLWDFYARKFCRLQDSVTVWEGLVGFRGLWSWLLLTVHNYIIASLSRVTDRTLSAGLICLQGKWVRPNL